MKQIVLNVPDNKYQFFLELVKSLPFVKIKEEHTLSINEQEFIEGTKKSIKQVDQHLKGEVVLKTADQLIDEL